MDTNIIVPMIMDIRHLEKKYRTKPNLISTNHTAAVIPQYHVALKDTIFTYTFLVYNQIIKYYYIRSY